MSLLLLLLPMLMLIGYLVGVTSSYATLGTIAGNRFCPKGCVCSEDFAVDCSYAGLGEIPHVAPKTRILILHGNSIKNIRKKDISRMRHLEELYLHGNMIHDIAVDTFGQLLRLKLLDLSDNPLHCGCNLKSALELFKREEESVNLQLLNLERTMCYFPEDLRGTSTRVIHSGAVDCQQRERRHSRHDDFCNSNPCMNGGTCHPRRRESGRCDCPEGYSGRYCEWRQGKQLKVTIDDVTGYYIKLRWIINVDVRDFRIDYVEEPAKPLTHAEQECINGTARSYKLTDVQPHTRYKICIAAFSYNTHRRSPELLIERVCLYQSTDPIPSTVDNTYPQRPQTQHIPTNSLNTPDGQTQTQMVMTIFGTILSICVILILAVVALYLSRLRGIRLIPRRRRRSLPNIVQVNNPTYRSTGSPTPSMQDVPIEENARTNEDIDAPFILVTSDGNEELVAGDSSRFQAETMCADAASNSSFINALTPSSQDETTERKNGDGESTHEEDDFENGYLMRDNVESEKTEKEIIKC